MGDACSNPPDSEGVQKMLMKNFDRHYSTNRYIFFTILSIFSREIIQNLYSNFAEHHLACFIMPPGSLSLTTKKDLSNFWIPSMQ